MRAPRNFTQSARLFRTARFIDNRAQMWYYSDDDMFSIALTNVLITLCYIIPGFALCRLKKACADHLSTLSAVLVYVCSPCMIASSMLEFPRSARAMADVALFFAVFLLLQLAFMLILFALCRKRYGEAKYRIFTVASVMGNVGFFGLPIIKALFPGNPEVMAYSCVASVALNMLTFTAGVYCTTGDKSKVSITKGIFNPNTIGFIAGVILSLSGAENFLPEPLISAVGLVGDMSTPVCMLILGIRLGAVSFSKLFARPIIYLTVAAKLLIFPLFCYAAVYFLPLSITFKASVTVLASVPCASMVLNIAELYGGETELSANCVLLSTLLCFITIPLLTLLI